MLGVILASPSTSTNQSHWVKYSFSEEQADMNPGLNFREVIRQEISALRHGMSHITYHMSASIHTTYLASSILP
jgi:hypothetical protein